MSNRRAMVRLTQEALADFLTEGEHHYRLTGVPAGAKVLGVFSDPDCQMISVLIESMALEPLSEGRTLPWIIPLLAPCESVVFPDRRKKVPECQ